MCVALVIQRVKRMSLIVSCGLLALWNFSTLSHKRFDFRKKVTEYKMFVLIFCTILSENVVFLRRIQRDIAINENRSSCKSSVFSCRILMKLKVFSADFLQILKYKISWKWSRVRRVFLFVQTDRQTDMTKLIAAFRNSAKAPQVIRGILWRWRQHAYPKH